MQVTINTLPTLAEFNRKLSKKQVKLAEYISEAIKLSALSVEAEAKKVTPVDTGRLRASIYTSIYKDYAVVQPKTDYAIFVHEGTRYMKGRPFMMQGLNNSKDKIKGFFETAIKRALNS